MKKNLANIITGFRILGSITLIFLPMFSLTFYIMYLLCGVSDAVDGRIARITGSEGESGAVFDTVADFIFVAVMFVKFIPVLEIEKWLWIWIAAVTAVKAGNIIYGFICEKKLISPHTVMNKITGFLLFVFPLTLNFIDINIILPVVGIFATFAAIQEIYCIRRMRHL